MLDWITESQVFFGYEDTCDFSLVSDGLKNVGSSFSIQELFEDALKLQDCIESVETVGTRKLVVAALDLTTTSTSLLKLTYRIDYIDLGALFPPIQVIDYSTSMVANISKAYDAACHLRALPEDDQVRHRYYLDKLIKRIARTAINFFGLIRVTLFPVISGTFGLLLTTISLFSGIDQYFAKMRLQEAEPCRA